jgi:hypothetical protein
VAATGDTTEPSDHAALVELFRVIASGDSVEVARRLDSRPDLARRAVHISARGHDAEVYFLSTIEHYMYGGDTALHIAAAAYQRDVAESVVSRGADIRARNRRGAEPLHYAADGTPGEGAWDPPAQRGVVEYLIAIGADPNARDASGVAPLHRAVRTRCSEAVEALLENGADPRLMNKQGSTPLHLAVQNTGRGHSGTAAGKDEQRSIIASLLRHGAGPTDLDAKGKTVEAAAASDSIRDLLTGP